MSDSSGKVECAEHGTREATYICQHLVGARRGFHWGVDEDDPDELWPDAWCDACEQARQADNGWNDRSEALAAVRLVCDCCYERARERNWRQDDRAFSALVSEAVAAYLLGAKGACRSPKEGGASFMVMTHVGWAQ